MDRSTRPRCIVSVDLEEWCDARIAGVPLDARDRFPPSLGYAVARLLDLFERTGTRATFFVLGRVARRYRDLIVRIARDHEIASHGETHACFRDLGPERAADELRRSCDLLAELAGREILGFRAPNWSLGGCLPWAVPLLAEQGIAYDSSIVPGRGIGFLRGEPGAPRGPYLLSESPRLWEFPPTVLSLPGVSFPAAGGALLRAFPLPVVMRSLARDRDAGVKPHLHLVPWEIAPPEGAALGPLRRALMFAGWKSVGRKLERILAQYQGVPIFDCMRELDGNSSATAAAARDADTDVTESRDAATAGR